MQISGLDHVVILCGDYEGAIQTYSTLLGRSVDWRYASPDDGTATALFVLENTAIELLAPYGDGPMGDRIKELLGDRPGHLSSLVFRTHDIDAAHHTATRRGLAPDALVTMQAQYEGLTRQWTRFRCKDDAMAGLKVFMCQQVKGELPVFPGRDGDVFRLDHLVVNTTNPDRAMACYGAKLGLRLALDRTNTDWGSRFLFFRLPDLTFEVVRRLDSGAPETAPDTLWGLTWQVRDLDAARDRMIAAGVDVSEVRKGRKPGTRVMSVRSHDLGVPTLFLEQERN